MCPDSVDGSASVLWSTGTRSINGTPAAAVDGVEDLPVSTAKSLLPTIVDVSTEEPRADALRLVQSPSSTPVRFPGTATSRESFESEMTQAVAGGRIKETRVSGPSRHTDLSTYSQRESSQTTVNVQKHLQSCVDSTSFLPECSSPPPIMMARDRDSDMLEITEEEVSGGYLARSVIAPGVYYFGIIDILQKWTLEKKLERWVKALFRCKISGVPHRRCCM